jgi:membrane-bound serine protease (ClpP class)
VVRFLTHPLVSPFLLSLGFLGLLVEIKSPGVGLAGAAGVVSLALFFGSHLVIGLAGLEALLLFGAGAVLVALEIFLVPGLGLLGVVGGLGMIAGLFMSLIGGIPTMADFTRAGGVILASILLVVVIAWALLRRLPSGEGRLNRLGIFLSKETSRATGYSSALRRGELVGKEGTAATDLRPSGTGLFGDERIDIVSDAGWIESGTPVRIVASEGYRHVVRPVPPPRQKA